MFSVSSITGRYNGIIYDTFSVFLSLITHHPCLVVSFSFCLYL